MDLLFKRKRYVAPNLTSIKKVYFKLNAQVELDEEEEALVSKYSLRDAAIINKPNPAHIRMTLIVAVLATLVAFVIFRLIAGGAFVLGPVTG